MSRSFHLPEGWPFHAKTNVPAPGHPGQRILGYRVSLDCENHALWPLDCIPDAKEFGTPLPRIDQNNLAKVLLEAFQKAEPDHTISKHPISFMATFADLAAAVIEHFNGGTPARGSKK
jgi:hypothetical protein